jgi:hypothetical protein
VSARKTVGKSKRMYFPFFALVGVFGGSLQLLRRLELRLTGDRDVSTPRDWTLRGGEGAPSHFATPSGLARDDWWRKRGSLDVDVWADERHTIDAPLPGRMLIQPVPPRREFILNTLDGGECLYRYRPGVDVPRTKISANAKHRYIPKTSPFYRKDRVPSGCYRD